MKPFLNPRPRPRPNPRIAPIADDPGAPLFSVMIPTYQCTERFERALRSVLDQDPGPGRMQIAVVDDCSTGGVHEETVRRLAPTRVAIHRQPVNLGLAGNWNTCIALSRGRWVHLLHQDDFVLPGFYERLALADAHPEVGAAFCRYTIVDNEGQPSMIADLHRPTAGVLADWLATASRHQHVQFASIVVRRKVYEQVGGFRDDLVYTLDWEMWVRIAASHAFWYEPEMLACYRVGEGTETSRLWREGRHISDLRRAIGIVSGYLPPELRATAGERLLDWFQIHEMEGATRALLARDVRSGLASLHRAFRVRPALLLGRTPLVYYQWALRLWLRDRLGLGPGRNAIVRADDPGNSPTVTEDEKAPATAEDETTGRTGLTSAVKSS